MAITVSELSPRIRSNLIPGFGYEMILNLVPDNSYDNNGDVIDLTAYFPNEVYGGHPIHYALATAATVLKYKRATSGAPDTGAVQAYVTNTSGADVVMPELSAGAGNEGITECYWVFYGR